jgi:hypothetical protein
MKTYIMVIIGVVCVGVAITAVILLTPKKIVVQNAPSPVQYPQMGGSNASNPKPTALDWVKGIAESGIVEGLITSISGLFKKDKPAA